MDHNLQAMEKSRGVMLSTDKVEIQFQAPVKGTPAALAFEGYYFSIFQEFPSILTLINLQFLVYSQRCN